MGIEFYCQKMSIKYRKMSMGCLLTHCRMSTTELTGGTRPNPVFVRFLFVSDRSNLQFGG